MEDRCGHESPGVSSNDRPERAAYLATASRTLCISPKHIVAKDEVQS